MKCGEKKLHCYTIPLLGKRSAFYAHSRSAKSFSISNKSDVNMMQFEVCFVCCCCCLFAPALSLQTQSGCWNFLCLPSVYLIIESRGANICLSKPKREQNVQMNYISFRGLACQTFSQCVNCKSEKAIYIFSHNVDGTEWNGIELHCYAFVYIVFFCLVYRRCGVPGVIFPTAKYLMSSRQLHKAFGRWFWCLHCAENRYQLDDFQGYTPNSKLRMAFLLRVLQ